MFAERLLDRVNTLLGLCVNLAIDINFGPHTQKLLPPVSWPLLSPLPPSFRFLAAPMQRQHIFVGAFKFQVLQRLNFTIPW